MELKNILLDLEALQEENNNLKGRVELLEKYVKALKLRNGKLTLENKELVKENENLKDKLANVTLWDLSPEMQEACGHALAADLLRK